jgi:16S rRNA (guanine966-N2)-methyltransferase
MDLRIISGDLKGRRIALPERQVTFRPTKDRVRQSVAEIIKEKIPGSRCADFCAGSGAFGVEMASRRASSVHFVERDRLLCRSISKHIEAFGIAGRCRVFEQDVTVFVRRRQYSYDIIFFDPPYENEALAALTPEILHLLSKDGLLLYERSTRRTKSAQEATPPPPDGFSVDTKIYGDTAVDIFRKVT